MATAKASAVARERCRDVDRLTMDYLLGIPKSFSSCGDAVSATTAEPVRKRVAIRSGVMAIGGGLFRLPKRVPRAFAMEVILGGQFYDASTFHQHGVVNRLTESGQALQEATKWATALLDNAPLAMLCSKEIVDLSAHLSDEEAWRRQEPAVRRVFESRDRAEGLAAFAEKRKPRWSGQ